MNTRMLSAAFALGLAAAAPAAPESGTTTTVASATVTTVTATSATQWMARPWGETGVVLFANAPYPDESRMNGFRSKRGYFPYEGHYDDSTVVFAIPAGYKPGPTVDFIIHFHGHNNEAQKVLAQYRLGEQLRDSGRNAILIIPQGAKYAPDEDIGRFEKPDGFARFMAEAMDTLRRDGKIPPDARLGNIILGGHSGGYWPIAKVLEKGGVTSSTREVWLFDAAYGGLNEISAPFTDPKSAMRLRSVFTDHLTTKNMQIRSNLAAAGRTPALFEEDRLTTEGTTEAAFKSMTPASPGAAPGKDELPSLLRAEPLLFLHTRLAHDAVATQYRYFEKFARESPFLNPKQ